MSSKEKLVVVLVTTSRNMSSFQDVEDILKSRQEMNSQLHIEPNSPGDPPNYYPRPGEQLPAGGSPPRGRGTRRGRGSSRGGGGGRGPSDRGAQGG